MAKQKEALISFELDTAPPTLVPLQSKDVEFMTQRIETLTNLLTRLLHTTGQLNGNAQHAKNRCYDCALRANHELVHHNCNCVCHEARTYLTQLSSE